MAETADVLFVRDNIEDNFVDHGWSETMITERLDSGSIRERVVATYWAKRAQKYLLLVNTSESGSSRGNDSIYPRLKGLADEWEARAVAIENPPVSPEVANRGRLGSFPIRRV